MKSTEARPLKALRKIRREFEATFGVTSGRQWVRYRKAMGFAVKPQGVRATNKPYTPKPSRPFASTATAKSPADHATIERAIAKRARKAVLRVRRSLVEAPR